MTRKGNLPNLPKYETFKLFLIKLRYTVRLEERSEPK